jgi:RNA polymerase sigma-70 factor (ECF subfamily)
MDRALVERAREGDHEAFSSIVATSVGRLNAIARLTLGDRDLAEDAVQEAFVDAWRSLPGLRDPDRFEGWLTRVLVRTCQDARRRRSRRRTIELPLLADIGPRVADHQAALAVSDSLERGLRALTVDQRSVLVLSFYLDLPIAEAASILGIPVGTMKSRINRAIAALRATVDADERPAVRTAARST